MNLHICIIALLILVASSTFSIYHKRYSLKHRDYELSILDYERVISSKHVKNSPTFNITKPIQYEDYDLINYRFIGAGASG